MARTVSKKVAKAKKASKKKKKAYKPCQQVVLGLEHFEAPDNGTYSVKTVMTSWNAVSRRGDSEAATALHQQVIRSSNSSGALCHAVTIALNAKAEEDPAATFFYDRNMVSQVFKQMVGGTYQADAERLQDSFIDEYIRDHPFPEQYKRDFILRTSDVFTKQYEVSVTAHVVKSFTSRIQDHLMCYLERLAWSRRRDEHFAYVIKTGAKLLQRAGAVQDDDAAAAMVEDFLVRPRGSDGQQRLHADWRPAMGSALAYIRNCLQAFRVIPPEGFRGAQVEDDEDAPPGRQPFFTTGHNTAEQLFSAGFLREDDPRFAFATYKDVPMDGLAKTAARLPWASYTISYPGHTMDTHFSHVVHWGASANLDLPAFCRMAAPLYGHAATFLLDQRIALATPGDFPFATPAAFFNACISLGDNIPSVADVRRQLEALKLTRGTTFEAYQSNFFRILREYGHYAAGREFKTNPFATAQAFLQGFSMKFRTLIDEHLLKSNLEVSNTTALLALTKRLWTTFPDYRYDDDRDTDKPQDRYRTDRPRRFTPHGGDHPRVAIHDARVTTGQAKNFSDLSTADQATLKDIHKTMKKRVPLSPTQYAFCQKHFVCFSCGSLAHRAADCPKRVREARDE